jgi:hypothetical protein
MARRRPGRHRSARATGARRLLVLGFAATFGLASSLGAWAYWTAGSYTGSNGAAAATHVNQGATPTLSATGQAVTVSWAPTTLTTGQAVTGYLVKRYDAGTSAAQTILSSCTGTVAAVTCVENSVPPGSWVYTVTPVFASNWQGVESGRSSTVVIETTPPANALSLSTVSGGAYLSGTTAYYRGTAAGSFTVTNALTDAGSGPASSATAALGGTTTGWTHTPSTVSTPAGGPYVSNLFSWAASTASGPTETITYSAGYVSARQVSVSFTDGTDGGSGIGTRRLQRASATLSNGTCGTFSAFADLGGANPSSPYLDTYLTNGTCYQYQYVVSDNVGNQMSVSSANQVKVDYGTAVNTTAGLVSQWRFGEHAAFSDTFTGTAGTVLTSHTGDVGGSWTAGNGTATGVLSDANRLRKNGTGYVYYYPTNAPTWTDGSVGADITVLSNPGDQICVIGRWDNSGNFYEACYYQPSAAWLLRSYNSQGAGFWSTLGSYAQTLTVGQTYRLRLSFIGSAISLWVDNVSRVAVSDTTAPGTNGNWPGVELGFNSSSPAVSDTTGYHIDNFQMVPRAADSKGSNTADYFGGVTLGGTGAPVNDANPAAQFDGVNDFVRATSPTGAPTGATVRSAELWFKTTSTAQQVLFDYGSLATAQEFGLWLNANSASMTAWGYGSGNDLTFPLAASVTDGSWHHVVETYDGTSIRIYVDGGALTAQAATRNTALDSTGFNIGAVTATGDVNSGGYFNGSLDEVALYNTVLSQTTVTNHYQIGTAPPAPSSTGPTGGSVDAASLGGTGTRYSTGTTLTINLAKGTDPDGLAATGSKLLRATATLTSAGGTSNGACGSYGSYTLVSGGTDPASPKSDTVNDQACYRYQYVVPDALGNTTTYTSPDVKVDSTGPSAPSLTFSAFTNAYWSGSGSTVYYRSAAGSGGFTVTASATDAASGIASYAFPAPAANWTATAGALGVDGYSWSGTPGAPGSDIVTATNNAGVASAGTSFTVTADDTGPTAGTVSYLNGTTSGTSVSVSFTNGTDAGSGIGTRLLQRTQATLSGGVCGSFGGYATVATNPASPYVDTVSGGTCYKYQYLVADNLGNVGTPATSASVAKVTSNYAATVTATAGLVGYWRLGETTRSADSFTGAAGTLLSDHTADSGSTWTHWTNDTATSVLSDSNRLRRNGTGGVTYLTSAVPPGADYQVSADIYVKSLLSNDAAGVVGRFDTSNTNGTGTRYMARYNVSAGYWELRKDVNGGGTLLGSYTATPTVGQTYNVALDMKGSTIRMLVDGVERVSVTDTSITAAGRAGTRLGSGGTGTSPTDTTGMHLDNFRLTPPAADSAGTNRGDYLNGTTLGAAGAIAGDPDTAAQFDGSNDAVSVSRQVSGDLSVEFWFKSTQGIGTSSNWWNGAALVDNTAQAANQNDWGVSLRADGRVVAGVGNPDTSIVSAGSGYNDGAWHHVVFTRSSAGPFLLYVDGTQAASGTGGTAARTSIPNISFGREAETGGMAYAGYLDEVSIYNTVLSAATISGHHNAGM